MRKNEAISPMIAESVVAKATKCGNIHVERVGKIMDKLNPKNSIAEKMIVFWCECGIVVFRTSILWLEDFPIMNYYREKYPSHNTTGIIAEIEKLRKEWTSGII